MKTGNIPDKLKFFARKSTKAHWRWEDVEGGDLEFDVLPCYISDANNKKTCETGKHWADQSSYDYDTKKHIKYGYDEFEIDNKPFKNLKIITLEIRDKGGRAYKVCADIGKFKNLYFDARECIILDSMFEVGISKGGIIEGEFIFAKVGAQMMPVRVGSYLHKKMIEATEFDKKGKIKELEIGGIYQNKRGEKVIYLGQRWARNPEIEYERTGYYNQEIKSIEFSKPYLAHVFFTYYEYKEGKNEIFYHQEDEKSFGRLPEYKKGNPAAYNFDIIKNHSYKEKVKQIEVPDNYIEEVIQYRFGKYKNKENRHYKDLEYYGKLFSLTKTKDEVNPCIAQYIK